MINKLQLKFIIFFIVAIVSIFGLCSCAEENPTSASDFSTGESNSGGSSKNTSNIPSWDKNLSFSDSGKYEGSKYFSPESYLTIYTPYTISDYVKVSYDDTESLTRLWKAMIDRKGLKDGSRYYIQTTEGELYFDKDYNIRWSKKPNVILKKFKGGVIVQYKVGLTGKDAGNEHDASGGKMIGKYAIAGLYTYALGLPEVMEWKSDMINLFFGYYSAIKGDMNELYADRIEILVLNGGLPLNEKGTYTSSSSSGYFALQSYLDPIDNGYANGNKDLNNILGESPEKYISSLKSYNLYKWGFRWQHKKYDLLQ